MISLYIREPFYSAAKTYGWEKGVPGIGIKATLVDAAEVSGDTLSIRIGTMPGKEFWVAPPAIREAERVYHSRRSVGYGTVVIVVPITILEEKDLL